MVENIGLKTKYARVTRDTHVYSITDEYTIGIPGGIYVTVIGELVNGLFLISLNYDYNQLYIIEGRNIELGVPQAREAYRMKDGYMAYSSNDIWRKYVRSVNKPVKLRFAGVKLPMSVISNTKDREKYWLEDFEVVRFIRLDGKMAVIKPYNMRKDFLIKLRHLDFLIPQDEDKYNTIFGVRQYRGRRYRRDKSESNDDSRYMAR